jgi:hypothetical protein
MWHYAKDGQPVGPFSEVEIANLIRTGIVLGETLVWHEGTTDWLRADQSPLIRVFPHNLTMAPEATFPNTPPKQPSKIQNTIIGVLAGVVGFAATKMLPGQVVIRIFAGGVAGLLCGLLPFLCGRKKNPKLAKAFLTWCCVAGCAFGALLALPLAITFTIIILVKEPAPQNLS